MDINSSKTSAAYDHIAAKMEFLSSEVHNYVLRGDYLEKREKAITKAITKLAGGHKELLLQTFIGKLRFKLPQLHLGHQLGEYDMKRVPIIASALVTQVLLDNGSLTLREEVERIKSKSGETKFKKFLYVQLGGTPERDLYKGIQLEPGVVNQWSVGERRLTGAQREFLAKVASVPFKIWDGCTKPLLLKGYELKVDWNKKTYIDKRGVERPVSEDPICKHNRFGIYADKIVDHVKKFPRFYLSAKYDHRFREYYEAATLDGIRPHGKLWETLMIDAAEPRLVTAEDLEVLRHIIYVTIHGRVSVEQANKRFNMEDLFYAEAVDPMGAKTEKQFGEAILLNKAAEALHCYTSGELSGFLFGYDFTNSGLLMAGCSFKSTEMMRACNLAGLKTVTDSHSVFGKSFGLDLPRDEIKKIHTALLHGSTTKTLKNDLCVALGKEDAVTLQEVEIAIEKAYGPTVHNIDMIASWGGVAVGNKQSILRWRMPDGFIASSKAKMLGCPVHVYVASASHKEHYTDYVVVSDMPLVTDKNGYPIFDKHTMVKGMDYPVRTKKRGLFADITHSIDAYMLRNVTEDLLDAGFPVLLKHDDFIAPPGGHGTIRATAQRVFSELHGANLYQSALNDIAENSPYEVPVPTVILGKGKNKAMDSYNFLMP